MNVGDKVKLATEAETAEKENPKFENSISMGRKSGTTVGTDSVAAGNTCEASKDGATAFGNYTKASGKYAFVANNNCTAGSDRSAAFGQCTKAQSSDQFVCGRYNETDDAGKNLFIVGNGNSTTRKNAFTVSSGGTGTFSGEVVDGAGNILSKIAEKAAGIEHLNFKNVRLTAENLIIKPNMIFLAQGNGRVHLIRDGEPEEFTFSDLCFGFCTGDGSKDTDAQSVGKFRLSLNYKTGALSYDTKISLLETSDSIAYKNFIASREGVLYVFYVSK